jgi:hypothetical protein
LTAPFIRPFKRREERLYIKYGLFSVYQTEQKVFQCEKLSVILVSAPLADLEAVFLGAGEVLREIVYD